jgi:type III secretory pathway lipoprotein EscJ
MIELVRTNDLVLISFVESLLTQAGVRFFVADNHMSATEGSLGFLPRRILVDADQFTQAQRLLREAGLSRELSDG